MYFGCPKSARLLAYTKTDLPVAGPATRIEARLKPLCPGHQIAALKNPLAKISMYPASLLDGLLPGIPGRLLADSMRVRGIKRALKVLPPKDRKIVEKALSASISLLPDNSELWKGWAAALIKVDLGKELGALT